MKVDIIEIDVASSGHITNTYLAFDEKDGKKEGILIDPADDTKKILDEINNQNVKVRYIVVTHAHGDHIGALEEVQKNTNAKILIHKNDKEALTNVDENYSHELGVKLQNIKDEDIIEVEDGYKFEVLSMQFEVIHTPGHTAGCICIYESNSNILFTGDTIFCDCYGRCDLYSGSFSDMVNSLRKIFNRFYDVMIYPGHDKQVKLDSAKRRIRLLISLKGVTL